MKLLSHIIALSVSADPVIVTTTIVSAIVTLQTTVIMLAGRIRNKNAEKLIAYEKDMWAIE